MSAFNLAHESADAENQNPEAGVETPPNMEKITELQKKATELQQSLLQEMQTLQTKVTAK